MVVPEKDPQNWVITLAVVEIDAGAGFEEKNEYSFFYVWFGATEGIWSIVNQL